MFRPFHRAAALRPPFLARSLAGVTVAGLLLAGSLASPTAAEPLPKERCLALTSELSLLEGGGAGTNIEKGPEWAKTHLTPEQIAYVRRLIAVREDLLFRCREYDIVRDPPPPSTAPVAAPVPGRKPETPAAGMAAVPPPVRPERQQAKATPADDGTLGSATDEQAKAGKKPKLRGTLPAAKKGSKAVPPPDRKAKSAVPEAADKN